MVAVQNLRELPVRARNEMKRVRSTEPTGEACKGATRKRSEGYAQFV